MTDGLTDTVTGAPGTSPFKYLVACPYRLRPFGSVQFTVTMRRETEFGVTFCDDAMEYSRRFIGLTIRMMSWKLG